MLNKKILAAAIAAAMSNVAVAAVDLDAAAPVAANYAQELAWGQNPVLVENTDGTPSYAQVLLGFTVAEGTSKYLRFDLENGAVFESQPSLSFPNLGDFIVATTVDSVSGDIIEGAEPKPQANVSAGGVGENFVIFELTAFEEYPGVDEDIPSALQVQLEVEQYSLPTDVETIIHYRLYEDAVDAQRLGPDLANLDETLKNRSAVLAMFDEGVSGVFANANDNTASVDTEFTRFLGDAAAVDSVVSWNGASVSAETANVGVIDVDLLARTGFFNLDGGTLVAEDIVGANPVLTFSGDFSFGTWTVHELSTTAPTADIACGAEYNSTQTTRQYDLVLNPNGVDTITMEFNGEQDVLETTDYALCVEVSQLDPTRDDVIVDNGTAEDPYTANRIRKGDYEASVSWDMPAITGLYDWNELDGGMGSPFTNDIGTIHYDTITVEVPYITNLSNYNQRVYIVNDGPTPADFVIEFIPEEGFTATAGTQATGTVEAGTTLVLNGSGILADVTDGVRTRTRSAAKLYIDGKDDDIQVMLQQVNAGDGSTDTTVLNANSVVGKTTNYLDEKTQ